ncbi:MAG: hypothetical protein R3F18_06755 [Lysobacterales bacterium]
MGRARYRYVALEDTLQPRHRGHRISRHRCPSALRCLVSCRTQRQAQPLAEQQAPEELGRLMLTRAGGHSWRQRCSSIPATSLAECVRLALAHVSCLLVGERGDPAIATRTDILYALALAGAGPDAPVGPLARKPLIAVEAHAVLLQALVRMTRHRVERVVVREGRTRHPLARPKCSVIPATAPDRHAPGAGREHRGDCRGRARPDRTGGHAARPGCQDERPMELVSALSIRG